MQIFAHKLAYGQKSVLPAFGKVASPLFRLMSLELQYTTSITKTRIILYTIFIFIPILNRIKYTHC